MVGRSGRGFRAKVVIRMKGWAYKGHSYRAPRANDLSFILYSCGTHTATQYEVIHKLAMLLSQTRQRSAPLSPVLPSATLPLPRQFPFTPGFQQGPTANGIASQADQLRFHADRRELEAIQLRELQCPNALRRGMEVSFSVQFRLLRHECSSYRLGPYKYFTFLSIRCKKHSRLFLLYHLDGLVQWRSPRSPECSVSIFDPTQWQLQMEVPWSTWTVTLGQSTS